MKHDCPHAKCTYPASPCHAGVPMPELACPHLTDLAGQNDRRIRAIMDALGATFAYRKKKG